MAIKVLQQGKLNKVEEGVRGRRSPGEGGIFVDDVKLDEQQAITQFYAFWENRVYGRSHNQIQQAWREQSKRDLELQFQRERSQPASFRRGTIVTWQDLDWLRRLLCF